MNDYVAKVLNLYLVGMGININDKTCPLNRDDLFVNDLPSDSYVGLTPAAIKVLWPLLDLRSRMLVAACFNLPIVQTELVRPKT